jgi:hypothetical protein
LRSPRRTGRLATSEIDGQHHCIPSRVSFADIQNRLLPCSAAVRRSIVECVEARRRRWSERARVVAAKVRVQWEGARSKQRCPVPPQVRKRRDWGIQPVCIGGSRWRRACARKIDRPQIAQAMVDPQSDRPAKAFALVRIIALGLGQQRRRSRLRLAVPSSKALRSD